MAERGRGTRDAGVDFMTVIVGIVDKGKVTIGADSAGISNLDRMIMKDPKVFRRGPIIGGYTTSFRMGQLLAHRLDVPALPKRKADLLPWMVGPFLDAVRSCLSIGSWITHDKGRAEGGQFLIGVRGRLFAVEADLTVAEPACGYHAVGCGMFYAIGSLFTTRGMTWSPETRLRHAMAAAAAHSAGVAEPFRILKETP